MMTDETANPEGWKRPSGFTRWRRTRPFWGGLLIILAGLEIFATERAPLRVMLHVGLQGVAGYAIPVVLVLLGALLLGIIGSALAFGWVPEKRVPEKTRRPRGGRTATPSSSAPPAAPPS